VSLPASRRDRRKVAHVLVHGRELCVVHLGLCLPRHGRLELVAAWINAGSYRLDKLLLRPALDQVQVRADGRQRFAAGKILAVAVAAILKAHDVLSVFGRRAFGRRGDRAGHWFQIEFDDTGAGQNDGQQRRVHGRRFVLNGRLTPFVPVLAETCRFIIGPTVEMFLRQKAEMEIIHLFRFLI